MKLNLYRDALLSFGVLSDNFLFTSKDFFLKKWTKNNELSWIFSRSVWSIILIIYYRKFIQKDKVKILLPSFYCGSTIKFIMKTDADILYYDLDSMLKPNTEDFVKLFKKKKPDIFILYHNCIASDYLLELKVYFNESNAWIIEDAVHFLLPNKNIGVIGDFVIYSPYKFLPIIDGAILVVTQKGQRTGFNNDVVSSYLKRIKLDFSNNSNSFFYSYFLILKFFISQLAIFLTFKKIKNIAFLNISVNEVKINNPSINYFSKLLFLLHIPKINSISISRYNNFNILLDIFLNDLYCDVFDQSKLINIKDKFSQNNFSPISFPIYFKKLSCAIFFYKQLLASSIQVFSWPDLDKNLIPDASFKKAVNLKQKIIYFPIQHSLKINASLIQIVFSNILKNKRC